MIMQGIPDMKGRLALACAVKAMNDNFVPEGLVPFAIVLGEYLRV